MKKNTPSPRLTRDSVLRGALDLLNEVGIDALTTRRLAEHLGVQSPTLYWHFKNKAELMAAMAEAIMLEQHREQPTDAPWQEWMIANAASFRRGLLAYRDGARLHAGSRPREVHFASIEHKIALLCRAGFSAEQAVNLLFAVGRFVVGWVLEEQQTSAEAMPGGADHQRYPLLYQGWRALDAQGEDRLFEDSVRLLVDGARLRLMDGTDNDR